MIRKMFKAKKNHKNLSPKIFKINIYNVIVVLSIICLALAILIMSEKKYYETGEKTLCTVVSQGNGCQIVQTSEYASIFGVNNPWFGIIGFFLLGFSALIFSLKGIEIFNYMTILGGVVSGAMALWFLYVQTFILEIYCVFCVVIDTVSLMLLAMSIYLIIMEVKLMRKK